MGVVILSCGRTGTNVALEILRGNSYLKASNVVEDKQLVKPPRKHLDNYLTKCDTIYFNVEGIVTLLNKNPKMKIVWTIRDPRDIILSKIFRGQPNTEGRGSWVSADGTPESAIASIRDMYKKYSSLKSKFPHRIILVKMEDLIGKTEDETKRMCEFLGLEFEEDMLNFPGRMRNPHKVKRYGNKISQGQISLWKNVKEIYSGFFNKQKYEIEKYFEDVSDLISIFDYDEV